MPADRIAPTDRRRQWSRSYPALLPCLIDGRRPSPREVEAVAARMLLELGQGWPGGAGGTLDEAALADRVHAAARVALEGEGCPRCRVPT